jgi:HAE1 family hydrophobic/amphiphilic exporter-1
VDLIKLSIKRPIFITMVTTFFVAIGVLALRALPVDLYPDVTYPVLAVRATLPGAAPEEVEQLVTKRLEDALSTIAGVKVLRSISRESQAIVTMEFDTGVDIRFQEIQVRAKVANVRPSLPEDMDEPTVFRQDPDDIPIVEIAVTGDRPASTLTDLTEDEIARRLRQIPGVGEVELSGTRKPEIRVELRREALDAWRVSAQQVVAAIRSFNRNDPAGKLEGDARVWVLRSLSHMRSAKDLEAIPVATDGAGQPIFLRDVAKVESTFEEKRNVSLVGDASSLRSAILVDVYKQSGENSLEVSTRVRAALDEIGKTTPGDVRIQVTRDNADLVRTNVADVVETLIIGAILTVLVVLLFLRSPRSTITTGLALPNSVITTFAAMAVFGFTINVMTLLSLSLAIGLLVDDAIVVRENIFRHLHARTMSAAEAAERGTREVILAVMATTLTIVAVFLPVGFMEGVTGQFFKQFALTVVFAILVSTWDALTMAPMLSAHFANIPDPDDEWKAFGPLGRAFGHMLHRFELWFDTLATGYGRLLGWLLPKGWIAAAVALVAGGLALWGFVAVPKSFLPAQLGDSFQVNLNGALAVPVDEARRVGEAANQRLAALPELDYWTLRAGVGFNGSANIRFSVKVKPEYAKNQQLLADARQKVRKALAGFPGYSTRVSEPSDPLSGGGGRFSPVAIQVSGEEIGKIREVALEARQLMMQVQGITDVQPIDDLGLPELRFYTNPALAAQYGVSAQMIGESLKIWVEGNTSNSLRIGDDQVPIRVRLDGGDRLPPGELLATNLYVNARDRADVAVPLANMVSWEPGAGPPVIVRENRQRIMRVNANLQPGAALGDITTELQAKLDELPLPSGYSVRIVGQSEQMAELARNVGFAILLGSFFVYMVLASLFESLTQPLTVMAAIPLAATGAVAALVLTGSQLDLYGGIGMILLAGIVAKNSILLVDFAIQRVRDAGVDPATAIVEAAPLRLRPILMTSVAMIAGMLPIATGLGAGGAARQSLGIATIGGVVSSTLLTLLVVPNLFVAMSRFTARVRRKSSRSSGA